MVVCGVTCCVNQGVHRQPCCGKPLCRTCLKKKNSRTLYKSKRYFPDEYATIIVEYTCPLCKTTVEPTSDEHASNYMTCRNIYLKALDENDALRQELEKSTKEFEAISNKDKEFIHHLKDEVRELENTVECIDAQLDAKTSEVETVKDENEELYQELLSGREDRDALSDKLNAEEAKCIALEEKLNAVEKDDIYSNFFEIYDELKVVCGERDALLKEREELVKERDELAAERSVLESDLQYVQIECDELENEAMVNKKDGNELITEVDALEKVVEKLKTELIKEKKKRTISEPWTRGGRLRRI
jgi:chromosome segregation ATPase